MTNTHTLHYVKPQDQPSISLMITGPLYPEASVRKEILNNELSPLTEERKLEIISIVKEIYN